jgi:hypothetical protein
MRANQSPSNKELGSICKSIQASLWGLLLLIACKVALQMVHYREPCHPFNEKSVSVVVKKKRLSTRVTVKQPSCGWFYDFFLETDAPLPADMIATEYYFRLTEVKETMRLRQSEQSTLTKARLRPVHLHSNLFNHLSNHRKA